MFARLNTPIYPVMDNMFLDVHFFSVPIRQIWSNFRKFKRMQSVNKEDQTLARGRVKDKVLRAKTQILNRNLEDLIHET